MSAADRFARVRALFDEISDLPPSARTAALEASSEDDAVKSEVRALLSADAEGHDWLDAPLRRPRAQLEPGQEVGPYRIVRLLDEGGMGAVFLARRERDFDQEVALKVIHRWSLSADAIRRFEAERQILASLRHPNIAQLLDGGVTEDGQPFFTMEYVEGVPITQFCRERDLGTRARLRLFATVCEAVRHAQQSLIVHRDLKPQNILVTPDGQVKLLDFGIAKVVDATELADPLTRTGVRLLSPGYCAPEQIRGEPVTTATDVFSLGVVLYEILVGRSPHRGISVPEVEAEVLSAAPRPPSASVHEAEDPARGAVSKAELRGDLDTICTTALRRDPSERYPAAADLLDDVRLYLEGRPIRARPPSWSYRLGKFLRRNALATLAAATVVLVITGLTVFYTLRLQSERDRARLEAEKAAAVARFVTGLFEASDPRMALGNNVSARELLDRGEVRVRDAFRSQPRVRASMLETMGRARRGLGDYEKAAGELREALEIRLRHSPLDAVELDRTRLALAEVLTDRAEYGEAEALFRAVIASRAGRVGIDGPETVEARQALGAMLTAAGRFDDAEVPLRAAVRRWRALDDDRLPSALSDLGLLLHEKNEYEECERVYREALARARADKGPVHPEIALVLYHLSQLLRDQARYEEALSMHRATLEMDRAIYGEAHPVVADDMTNLGFLLVELDQYDEAGALLEAALAMRRQLLEPTHPDIGRAETRLAHLYEKLGRYADAERYYRDAYAHQSEAVGPDHPLMAGRMNNLSWILYDQEKYGEALEWAERALALNLEAREPDSMGVALSRMHLARALRGLGRPGEAVERIEQSLATGLRLYGKDHPFVASCRNVLAQALLDRGELARADAELAEAVRALRAILEDDHVRIASVRETWGRVRWAQGDQSAARALWQQALSARQAALPAGHPLIQRLEALLARPS